MKLTSYIFRLLQDVLSCNISSSLMVPKKEEKNEAKETAKEEAKEAAEEAAEEAVKR